MLLVCICWNEQVFNI